MRFPEKISEVRGKRNLRCSLAKTVSRDYHVNDSDEGVKKPTENPPQETIVRPVL